MKVFYESIFKAVHDSKKKKIKLAENDSNAQELYQTSKTIFSQ